MRKIRWDMIPPFFMPDSHITVSTRLSALLFALDFSVNLWYSSGGWQLILCRIRDGGWGISKLFCLKSSGRWGIDGKRESRSSGGSPAEGVDCAGAEVCAGVRADVQQIRRFPGGVQLRADERDADRVERESHLQSPACAGRNRAPSGG